MYNISIYKKKGDICLWKKKKVLTCKNNQEPLATTLGGTISSEIYVVKHISVMTYQEALKFLMNYYDFSEKDICDLPNDEYSLPVRQLERYKNGETRYLSKKVVVAICVAFKVSFTISNVLLKLAGFSLNLTKEDMFYKKILCEYYSYSLSEINELLLANGLKTLTNKR